MWLILINQIPQDIRSYVQKADPKLGIGKNYLLQIWADGTSAAVNGEDALEIRRLAQILADAVRSAPREIALALSPTECKNLVIKVLQ